MNAAFRLQRGLLINMMLACCIVLTVSASEAANKSTSAQFDRSRLSAGDVSILDEIDRMETEMERLTTEEEKAAQAIAAADLEIKTLEAELAVQQKNISIQQAAATSQLKSLYKRSRVGEWEYLLDTRSLQDFERRKQSLLKLGRREAGIIDNYRRLLAELDARKKALDEKKSEAEAQRSKLAESRRLISEEVKRKAALIKTVREDKQLLEKAEKELSDARKQSDTSIAMLKNATIPADTKPGYEYLMEKKGTLACPLNGKISQGFGEITTGKKEKFFHSGLDIKAAPGTAVKSIANGKVVFSGKLRGYGRLVVVDHGRGYLSLYGYLEKIKVKQEAEIARGDIIGLIGDNASLKGPTLFFGLRKSGQPENPKIWTDCR